MNRLFLFLSCLLLTGYAGAQVPQAGKDTLLEIATWNTKWFGHPGEGPTNEDLQFENIRKVLVESGIDIWGLAEVSDLQTWNKLVTELGSRYLGYISTYTQAQKTALLYDRNSFQVIPSLSGPVLTGSEYAHAFASRPPLCVALKTRNRSVTDTVYFFVIHMKAYGDQDSYNRRVAASQALQGFLDAGYSGKRWVVLGDWNDDLYTSTYANSPSPYLNFSDTSRYLLISRQLTDAGKRSYAFGNPGRMLDHIMVSAGMKDWYLAGSARVLDELPSIISGFHNTTSDHYPVLGLFDNRVKLPQAPDTPVTGLDAHPGRPQVWCYPNPAYKKLHVRASGLISTLELYAAGGRLVLSLGVNTHSATMDLPQHLAKGVYLLKVTAPQEVSFKRVLIDAQ